MKPILPQTALEYLKSTNAYSKKNLVEAIKELSSVYGKKTESMMASGIAKLRNTEPKKMKFFNKLAEVKVDRNGVPEAYAAGAILTGSGAKSLLDASRVPDRVAIPYGYVHSEALRKTLARTGNTKALGGGHLAQAKTYQKFLQGEHNIKTDIVGGMSKKERLSAWWNKGKYKAYIDAGQGPSGMFKSISKVNTPAVDYHAGSKAKDIIPVDINNPGKYSKKTFFNTMKVHKQPVDPKLKYVTIGAGTSGIGLQDKTYNIMKNMKDKNARLVVMTGDMVPEKVEQLKKIDKRIQTIGRVPNKDYVNILRNSDLNIGYGGAASVTEQLSFKNPNISYTNAARKNAQLGIGNMDFAKRHYGVDYYTGGDEKAMGEHISKVLKDPKGHTRAKQSKEFLRNWKESKQNIVKEIEAIKPIRNKVYAYKGAAKLAIGAALIGGATYFGRKAKENE